MTGDEVRNQRLVEPVLLIDALVAVFEFMKVLEGRFAHDAQRIVGGVFRRNFQAPAHMAGDQLLHILLETTIVVFVVAIGQQIVADPTAHKSLFDLRMGIYLAIDFRQGLVTSIQVTADNRVDTGRCHTAVANFLHFALHAIHIGRRPPQIRNIPLKVRHFYHLLYFLHDRLLRAAGDKLALVRRDRTKATAPEAAAVHIDRKANHLKSRRIAPFLVLGMRQPGVGQVKRSIDLFLRHGRIRRVDDNLVLPYCLRQAAGTNLIGLLLDMLEIGSVGNLIAHTLLMRVERHRFPALMHRRRLIAGDEDGRLRDGRQGRKRDTFF